MEFVRLLALILTSAALGNCHTVASGTNPQPGSQTNQLNTQQDQNAKSSEPNSMSPYVYRGSPINPSTYVQNYQQLANVPSYARDTPGASPFLGLSTTGEFQLSAYFSQIFWGFVGVVVSLAVIVYLIRLFFPKENVDSLLAKIKDTKAGKSLDLDRITNMVYGAIENYSKMAIKEARGGVHPKR